MCANPQIPSDTGKCARVDDGSAQFRQLSLREIWMLAEQRIRYDQTQDGVTEKLQPLIGRDPAILIGIRTVSQCPLENLVIDD